MMSEKSILSVCVTTAERLPDLAIKNGQMVFVKDKHTVALDVGNSRTFYNQIQVLETEAERLAMTTPVQGCFYFVMNTTILWMYNSGWVRVTSPPSEVVYIGSELPESGLEQTLYVDKTQKNISVWDDTTMSYDVVADKSQTISSEEILELFK